MGDGVGHRFGVDVAFVALVLFVVPASADEGERSVGFEAVAAYPWTGRATAFVQEGIGDWLSARAGAGANFGDSGVEALGSFGLVAALDVFAWVPEVYVGIGGAVGDPGMRARVCARVAVRRYLSFSWSLAFSAGGEWTPDDDWLVLAGVGIWWHL